MNPVDRAASALPPAEQTALLNLSSAAQLERCLLLCNDERYRDILSALLSMHPHYRGRYQSAWWQAALDGRALHSGEALCDVHRHLLSNTHLISALSEQRGALIVLPSPHGQQCCLYGPHELEGLNLSRTGEINILYGTCRHCSDHTIHDLRQHWQSITGTPLDELLRNALNSALPKTPIHNA